MNFSIWAGVILLLVLFGAWYLFFRRSPSKEINIESQPEYGDPMPADRESPLVETFPSIANPDWSAVEEKKEKEDPEAEAANYQVDEEMVRDNAIGMSGYLTKEDQDADRQVTHVTVGEANEEPSEEELEDLQDLIDRAPAGEVSPVTPATTSTHFKGKFTDEEIRAIYNSDKANDTLAIQYDCSVRTIQRIKNRETYKHVEIDTPA